MTSTNTEWYFSQKERADAMYRRWRKAEAIIKELEKKVKELEHVNHEGCALEKCPHYKPGDILNWYCATCDRMPPPVRGDKSTWSKPPDKPEGEGECPRKDGDLSLYDEASCTSCKITPCPYGHIDPDPEPNDIIIYDDRPCPQCAGTRWNVPAEGEKWSCDSCGWESDELPPTKTKDPEPDDKGDKDKGIPPAPGYNPTEDMEAEDRGPPDEGEGGE